VSNMDGLSAGAQIVFEKSVDSEVPCFALFYLFHVICVQRFSSLDHMSGH
jgi:hypothetical protein